MNAIVKYFHVRAPESDLDDVPVDVRVDAQHGGYREVKAGATACELCLYRGVWHARCKVGSRDGWEWFPLYDGADPEGPPWIAITKRDGRRWFGLEDLN